MKLSTAKVDRADRRDILCAQCVNESRPNIVTCNAAAVRRGDELPEDCHHPAMSVGGKCHFRPEEHFFKEFFQMITHIMQLESVNSISYRFIATGKISPRKSHSFSMTMYETADGG